MSHQQRFNSNGSTSLDTNTDLYPFLGKIITNPKKENGDRHVSQADLEGIGQAAVSEAVTDIQFKQGRYAIKNQRIREWVSIEILKVLLNLQEPGIVGYELWLSNIIDDIVHHTDAILKAVTGNGTRYFSIDLTMSQAEIQQKLIRHKDWSNNVYVGNRQLRIPHVILYTEREVIYNIMQVLEPSAKRGVITSRTSFREGLDRIVRGLSGTRPALTFAHPDSRNTLVETPLDTKIIYDFMGRIGAHRAEIQKA